MRITALALGCIGAATLVGAILRFDATSDLPAFLRGASEVLAGRSPYGPTGGEVHTWLYAPWLAVVFIPFLGLRPDLSAALWHLLLATALLVSILPLLRTRTLEGSLTGIIVGAFGFHAVWAGHFEPLMIAALVYALPTRWGPVAIGLSASLKITPLVLCVRYAGRGDWRSVAIAVTVAIAMWMPALMFDMTGWGLPIGHTLSLLGYAPLAWFVLASAAVVAAWILSPTRFGWLGAATAWIAVMPRLLPYDVLALAVSAVRVPPARPDGYGSPDR